MAENESDKDEQDSKLTSEDETLIEAKAKDGEIVARDEQIDDITIDFDLDDFPELAKDQEGDKVVVVLCGYVSRSEHDMVSVEFNSASVVHGKLGDGSRFKRLEKTLSHRSGVTNPGALAAYIGRKKYGAAKMAKWSAAGRKRG